MLVKYRSIVKNTVHNTRIKTVVSVVIMFRYIDSRFKAVRNDIAYFTLLY